MKASAFFSDDWTGHGVVRSPFGQVLRRFDLSFEGRWSERHSAFHVDETARYADGRVLERRWVVYTDEQGTLVGADALQAARMWVSETADGFRIRFDRPRGVSGDKAPTSATLVFRAHGPDRLTGRGRRRILGLVVLDTRIDLRRAPAPSSSSS